jgi:para-nitrobenzyl esterase
MRALGVGMAVVVAALCLAPASGAAPSVVVDGGAISGVELDGITEYLGVPFASAGRFVAPGPAAPWPGVHRADSHSAQCPQALPLPIDVAVPMGGPLPANSENCLSIDLYVPRDAAGRNLPVMVYLYGGAFVLGANQQYDSPSEMVRDGDVIVAIPNYRVGPFGFLALPELAAETGGATGNYGIEDQQFALRWVRDNIASFGGNPTDVTLFGESAGGMSVCTQISSPGSKGLFTRAIVESGGCANSPLVPPTKAEAFDRSERYAAEMGCTDVATRLACLRAAPIDRLLDSSTTGFTSPEVTWTPSIDGVVLTHTPEQALRDGAAADIPMIVGSNADEGGTFLVLFDYLQGRIPSAASYAESVRGTYGDQAENVLAEYPVTAYPSPAAALSTVWTDSLFACPALDTTEATATGGGTVWQYRFADAPLGPNSPILPGAFHAAEIPYLFTRLGGVAVPWTGDAATLARQMKQRWTAFARTGNPNGPGLPQWDTWNASSAALDIDRTAQVMRSDFADLHRCAFWRA